MVDRVSNSPSRLPFPNSKGSTNTFKNGTYGSDIDVPLVTPDKNLNNTDGEENTPLFCDLNSKESSLNKNVSKPNVPQDLVLDMDIGKKHTEKGFETFLMTGDMIIKTNPSLKLRKMDGCGLERHHSDSSNPFDHGTDINRAFKRSASSPDQTTFTGAYLTKEMDDTSKTSPEDNSDEDSIDKKAASAESGFEEQAVHSDTGTLEKKYKLSNDPTSVSDLSELESDDMLGTMIESQTSAVSSNISTISTPSDLRSDISVNTVLQQEVEPLISDVSSSDSSIDLSSADSESGELSPEVLFERSMSDSGGMSPVNPNDKSKFLMASKSAEKIVMQKQIRAAMLPETQTVRASKSQENYFSDGVTFVNIDIEDTAYSLDQIACQFECTPTESEPSFSFQSDSSCGSNQQSEESCKGQERTDDRIFMPAFVKLDDSGDANNHDQGDATDSDEEKSDDVSNLEPNNSDSDEDDSCYQSVQSDGLQDGEPFESNGDNDVDDFHVSKQVEDIHDHETVIVQDDLFALPPAKSVDQPSAKRLAKRLYNLDGFRKSDVSRHLSKKNDFSTTVAEEYLKFFDFTNDTLDVALRKFLKQFSLIGETQERERVLAHFSRHYLQSNSGSFNSEDACHTLVCALMLLNTDLHGKAVGRKMTCGDFIENLSGLNDSENFPKEILKALYYAIKADPIEWAPDEEFQDQDRRNSEDQRTMTPNPSLPSLPQVIGRNPFLDVPDPSQTTEYKKGYMMRKCCLDPDGRKTAVGKRGWKMLFVVLRDMILYLYKDEKEMKKSATDGSHNAIRVHHSLASKAVDYNKKQHVLRLQTADWAEYLFQTSNSKELQEWIDTINFVAASLSAPPLPGAVGSQKKFQKPLLPASYTRLNFSEQLNSLEERLSGTKLDLQEHRASPPEKGSKASVIQHFLEKENYLVFETTRLETYIYLLQSKLASHTDLEPSLVETSIGEEEEGIKGVNNHTPTKKSPAQRTLTDRVEPNSNPDSDGVTSGTPPLLHEQGEHINLATESTRF